MKINRITVLLLMGLTACQLTAAEPVTAPAPAPKSWQPDSRAIYDLLVAQMQNASADFGGSADALVKYAKLQKDDILYTKAYTALLQTQRYADAVKLVKDWQVESELKLEKYLVLALVLNGEVDLAMTTIDKTLLEASEIEIDRQLQTYVSLLTTHWYSPNVLAAMSQLYDNYSDNTKLAMTLVHLYRWQNDIEKAVEIVDKALFADPKNLSLHQEKSDIYRYALQLTDAENVWKAILKDYPNDPKFQFAYARFLYDQFDFKAADEELKTIKVKTQYQQTSVDLLRAMTQIQLGNFDAVKDVIQWHKLDEKEKNSMNFDVANQLLVVKQPKLAKTYLEAIETSDEKGQTAFAKSLKLGEVAYTESLAKGNEWFDKLQTQFELTEAEITSEKARAMQEADLDEAAYELLTDYLAVNTNNDSMRYLRGLAAAELHKESIAAEDLGRIYARDPDNSDYQNALGYTLLSTADGNADKLKAAGKLIDKAIFVQPGSPAVVDSKGWLLYQQKDYEQSLPYFRFAYANYSDGEIIGHYIAALEKAGQLKLAKEIYTLEMQYAPNKEKIIHYTKAIKEQLSP